LVYFLTERMRLFSAPLLHNRLEQSLKTTLTGASDLTPRDPQEPFTPEYQSRLKAELGKPRNVIGAHYVCGNAAVRVPLSCLKTGTNELQIYLLGLHPAKQNASKRDIAKFLYLKTFCVQSQMEPKFGLLLPAKLKPTLSATECTGFVQVLLKGLETLDAEFADEVNFAQDG